MRSAGADDYVQRQITSPDRQLRLSGRSGHRFGPEQNDRVPGPISYRHTGASRQAATRAPAPDAQSSIRRSKAHLIIGAADRALRW
jgi:hypothetical protein